MLVSEIPALRDDWYPVAYSADIKPEPTRVRLFGRDHVVWHAKDGAEPTGAVDRCPHRAALSRRGGSTTAVWCVRTTAGDSTTEAPVSRFPRPIPTCPSPRRARGLRRGRRALRARVDVRR